MTNNQKIASYVAAAGVLGLAVYVVSRLIKDVEDVDLDLDFGNDEGLMKMFGKDYESRT